MIKGMLEKDLADLQKTLIEMMERMIQKGLMPAIGKERKEQVAKEVVTTLIKDPSFSLDKSDLKKEDTLKHLGAACMAQNDPRLGLDYKKLFGNDLSLTKHDKKLLEDVLKPVIDAILKKDPTKGKEISEKMENIARITEFLKVDVNKQLMKDLLIMKMLKLSKELNKQQKEQRRTDYGVDTQTPGEELIAIQAVCAGNQTGRQDLATSGLNFQADQSAPGSGKEDPMGSRFEATMHSLLDGQITSPAELSVALGKGLGEPITSTPSLTRKGPL